MVDLAFNLTVGSDNPACRDRPLFAWTGSRPDQGLIPPRTLGEDRHQVAIAVVAVREPAVWICLHAQRAEIGHWQPSLSSGLAELVAATSRAFEMPSRRQSTRKVSLLSKTVRQSLTDLELLPQPRKNILQTTAERIFDR